MNDSERQFKGIWIPKEIWLTKELTLQEKVVLIEVDSLETEERGCYASNKYFSEFFNLSTQRISQIIKGLETKGFIKIDYITKDKQIIERQLRIQKPPYPEVSNIFDRGIKYSKEGYQENFKVNNININNINNKKEIYKEKRFKKPSLEEIEEYCKQRNSSVDPKVFYEYFETGNWIDSKGNKVKNWKQKIITWERNRNPKQEAVPEWFNEDLNKESEIDDETRRLIEEIEGTSTNNY